jgi:phage portal protein BeeE
MQRLVEDLVQHSHGYWLIGDVAAGQISYVVGIDAADATLDKGVVRVGDREYVVSNPTTPPVPGQVIVFTGYRDGTLTLGTPAMTTAVALDALARHYAEQPNPTQALQNTSNYELADTEIDELLDGWKKARAAGTAAYLNAGVDLKESGFNAEQLQLEALTNMSALQAARLLNLDPMWVGASVSGSSLTYTNRVDARQDLIDLTLTDYTSPIAQRLSMPDACGSPVDFSTAAFLRANLGERARMAIDLFTAGLINRDEARSFVSESETGNPV